MATRSGSGRQAALQHRISLDVLVDEEAPVPGQQRLQRFGNARNRGRLQPAAAHRVQRDVLAIVGQDEQCRHVVRDDGPRDRRDLLEDLPDIERGRERPQQRIRGLQRLQLLLCQCQTRPQRVVTERIVDRQRHLVGDEREVGDVRRLVDVRLAARSQ
jgi:hypothetical protein